MKTRIIGDVTVSAIGLGGMPMSIEGRPDENRSISTIHAALDAGVTFFDTADAYHLHADEVGHNEELIARAVASYGGDTSDVLVATKGGHLRPGDGSWTVNGSPDYLKKAAAASLKRLGGDAIGLYQFHRPDPRVPYADSIGAIRDLLDAGTIRMAGISNADPAQIRLAKEILGGRLVSVQNQFSPAFRSSEPELALCDELGIAFLPWSPLGGIWPRRRLGTAAHRVRRYRRRPRRQPATGVSGLAVRQVGTRGTHPRVHATRDDPRLGRSDRTRPHRRRNRASRQVTGRACRQNWEI